MNIKTAKLIKKYTENLLFNVREEVPLGKEYYVDVDSISVERAYNISLLITHEAEMIDVYDDLEGKIYSGKYPTEILSLNQ